MAKPQTPSWSWALQRPHPIPIPIPIFEAHITGLLDRCRLSAEAIQRRPSSAALGRIRENCCRAARAPAACPLAGSRPEDERSSSEFARALCARRHARRGRSSSQGSSEHPVASGHASFQLACPRLVATRASSKPTLCRVPYSRKHPCLRAHASSNPSACRAPPAPISTRERAEFRRRWRRARRATPRRTPASPGACRRPAAGR